MAHQPEEVVVHGKSLTCAHCGGRTFYTRTVAVHGAGASLLGIEWFTQRGAFCHTCSDCGHMHWFLPKI